MTRKFQLGVAALLCFVGIVYLAAVEPTRSNGDLRIGAGLLIFAGGLVVVLYAVRKYFLRYPD